MEPSGRQDFEEANSMLGFLKRNLEISSQDTKTAAYYTLVRPNLECCASVWNPHHSQLVQKLEMVQRRAARYTTRRYRKTNSVTDMLESLYWESLQSRGTEIQLTMIFKIINNLIDITSSPYLTPSRTRTRAAHTKKMLQHHNRTDIFKCSFIPRTIPVWNYLPASVAEAPDLVSFKRGLSTLSF